MPTPLPHVHRGFGAVRPYLHGPVGLPAFVCAVFGATELDRHTFGPDKFHAELQISDGVVVIEAGALPDNAPPWQNTVYVYVPDVDATYARALQLGAEPVAAPEDKPYQERQCGFRDAGGNMWWVATCLPAHPLQS